MSYRESLEAAGATIHQFEEFGSYQGDWWAKVTFNGHDGWVNGSYGSCSGCDAFEAEFGWGDQQCGTHRYGADDPECPLCKVLASSYQTKLANFGKSYLDRVMTQEEAEAEAAQNIEWDSDAEQMLAYLKANA